MPHHFIDEIEFKQKSWVRTKLTNLIVEGQNLSFGRKLKVEIGYFTNLKL